MPLESVSGGGVAVELALGGTLLPGLVVAGQLTSQMITSTSVSYGGVPVDSYREAGIKYTTAGLLLEYYPDDSKGFSSGVGFGQMSAYREHAFFGYYYSQSEPSTGWFLAPQLGYAWWVSPQTSVGLLARVAFARVTGSEAYRDTEYTANVALPSLSLAMTYH